MSWIEVEGFGIGIGKVRTWMVKIVFVSHSLGLFKSGPGTGIMRERNIPRSSSTWFSEMVDTNKMKVFLIIFPVKHAFCEYKMITQSLNRD